VFIITGFLQWHFITNHQHWILQRHFITKCSSSLDFYNGTSLPITKTGFYNGTSLPIINTGFKKTLILKNLQDVSTA
jgi:hypothetical protein